MLSRRQVLGGLLGSGMLGGVAGCASNSNSVYSLFSKTIASRSGGGSSDSGYPLSVEEIHQLRYATLGVRIGTQPPAVVVLAGAEGQELEWVSADEVSFYTRGGRLVRTHGLKRDLAATRWPDADPLAEIARTGTTPPGRVRREIDLLRADEEGVAVESRFAVAGNETLMILGRQRQTVRIDEVADMPSWRWKTRNSYWVDPQSGRVWRSVQQYCPEMPPMELELLKPPALA